MSDTPTPAPLTQREMAQFVTLSTMPTLERALARLRWLEAEVAALKAHDPLAEMWRELAEYQPQADRDGHGESWARMCSERTKEASWAAADTAWATARTAASAAACDAASAAAWATAEDAAEDAAADAAFRAKYAREAIDSIRRAKEVQP